MDTIEDPQAAQRFNHDTSQHSVSSRLLKVLGICKAHALRYYGLWVALRTAVCLSNPRAWKE